MGLIQGITQGVTAKNAAKDQARANNELTRRMEVARQAYQQRRPQVVQERQAALQNQLGLYNPVAAMMGEMTGGKYSPNIQDLAKNFPVKPTATSSDLTANDKYRRSPDEIPYVTQTGIRDDLARQGYSTKGVDRDVKVAQARRGGKK